MAISTIKHAEICNAAARTVASLTDDFVLSVTDYERAAFNARGRAEDVSMQRPSHSELFDAQFVQRVKTRQRQIARDRRTPEQIEQEQTQHFARQLVRTITSVQDTIARFAARVVDDPADMLENCERVMEYAAEVNVAQRLLVCLTKHGYDVTINEARQHVFRDARYLERSTSATSNLMARFKLAAFAKFANGEQ